MNPSSPFYQGRFALLWHSLPSATCDGVQPAFDQPPNAAQGNPILSHWDLMLELAGGQLLTWRLPDFPLPTSPSLAPPSELEPASNRPACRLSRGAFHELLAQRLTDHRSAYLEYEGPISGGRGHVTRHLAGTYLLTSVDHTNEQESSWIERLRNIEPNFETISKDSKDAGLLAEQFFFSAMPSKVTIEAGNNEPLQNSPNPQQALAGWLKSTNHCWSIWLPLSAIGVEACARIGLPD